jgi:helix-turn-helix protein
MPSDEFRGIPLLNYSEHRPETDEAVTKLVRRPRKFTKTDLPCAFRTDRQDNDNWPFVLTRPEAAEMCRISAQTFGSWVRKGILPGPIPGTRRWSRVAIERGLAGGVVAPFANDHLSPFEQWKRDNAN